VFVQTRCQNHSRAGNPEALPSPCVCCAAAVQTQNEGSQLPSRISLTLCLSLETREAQPTIAKLRLTTRKRAAEIARVGADTEKLQPRHRKKNSALAAVLKGGREVGYRAEDLTVGLHLYAQP